MDFYNKFIKIINEAVDSTELDTYSAVIPDDSLPNILGKLKYILENFESFEKLELTSVLHNVNIQLSQLVDDDQLSEKLGTEFYKPKHDASGVPDYSDPNGSSYAAKKGFV